MTYAMHLTRPRFLNEIWVEWLKEELKNWIQSILFWTQAKRNFRRKFWNKGKYQSKTRIQKGT